MCCVAAGRIGEAAPCFRGLFVNGQHHRQGVGRKLVERFEQEYAAKGAEVFRTIRHIVCGPVLPEHGLQEIYGRANHVQFR